MSNSITEKIGEIINNNPDEIDDKIFNGYIIDLEKNIIIDFMTNKFNSKFDFINLRRIMSRMRKINFKTKTKSSKIKKMKNIVNDFL